jgi:hypothetical protein
MKISIVPKQTAATKSFPNIFENVSNSLATSVVVQAVNM